ncbi:MAG: flagellar hook basal-body protein [Planctomycetota bacterium]
MNVGLYRGAGALHAQQSRLEAIARNLANLSTVGYKRETEALRQHVVPGRGGERRGVVIERTVDFSQGDLRRTGLPYDLALYGEGFFAVEGPDGEMYTRDGSFRLGPDGTLLTAEGHPVAWAELQRPIDPQSAHPPVVDGDGTVRQGGGDIGRLRIVDFADDQKLRPDGQGYWHAPADLSEATATAMVHQGALEESNATGIEEMIEMIGVQRQFDSVARAMKSIQESYSRLTRPF